MKRLVLIVLCLMAISSVDAQTPFQFNFQAVARDLAGNPMVNEDVDFRLSILQGSEVGAAIFVESQSVQTNNFGLANLLVGTGTPEMGALDAIDWAVGPFFLQIELDINDGQGMQLMGVSAMTSVPYALHALTTEEPGPEGPQGEVGPQGEQGLPGIDGLDAVMDSSYVDSLVQAYVSTNGIGGGCDINFPDGYDDMEIIQHDFTISTYTVPAGKNLYVMQAYASPTVDLEVNGKRCMKADLPYSSTRGSQSIILKEGDVVSTAISGSYQMMYGYLTNSNVEPIQHDFTISTYTVPAGKNLYIMQAYASPTVDLEVNGKRCMKADLPYSSTRGSQSIILKEGDVVSTAISGSYQMMYGYLVDENFFANCGGGGSSTTSTLDSTAVADMIAGMGMGGGCDLRFPDGIYGEAVNVGFDQSTTYTVPSGKRLYITHFHLNNGVRRNGVSSFSGSSDIPIPITANPGDVLTSNYSNTYTYASGFLTNASSQVQSVNVEFDQSTTYTVPSGKRLYITHFHLNNGVRRNGVSSFSGGSDIPIPITANPGDVLTSNYSGNYTYASGYLADEDYFAGCGGGGYSTTTSSLDSTAVAEMIAAVGSSLPVGVIQAYAGESTPTDWLFCDGSAVSRTTYAELFSAIGESYGVGDGSTTFNLPDLRGRVPVGKDDMGGVPAGVISNNGDALGDFGGEETHQLTEDEMPSHSHDFPTYFNTSGGELGVTSNPFIQITETYSTNTAGGDQPHNNMQPYLITNYIIKVSEGNESSEGQQGEIGPQGEPGEQGEQGDAGQDGLSAYDIWIDLGNEGTEEEFITSLTGPQGPQGEPGSSGSGGSLVLTDAEMNAMEALPGQMVFNSTFGILHYWNGFNWVQLNGPCVPDPTLADAGEDVLTLNGAIISLEGNSPTYGNGMWTVVSGVGGAFSDPQDPNSTFSGLANGSYDLVWEITTPCNSTSDTVSIEFQSSFVFDQSSAYTIPNGISEVKVEMWGAGGGGGKGGSWLHTCQGIGSENKRRGGGGGAGAYGYFFKSVSNGEVISFNIGIGGLGDTSPANDGEATTCGIYQASGGSGGLLSTSISNGAGGFAGLSDAPFTEATGDGPQGGAIYTGSCFGPSYICIGGEGGLGYQGFGSGAQGGCVNPIAGDPGRIVISSVID